MKTIRSLALAAALSLTLPTVAVQAQTLSRDVGLPLQEARQLASRGQTSAAMQRVNRARNAANTAAERRKVIEMSAYVNTVARNYGAAANDLASIGAGASRLAPLYYQAGNYERAIQLGRQMGNTQGLKIVAQSYIKSGNSAEAAKVYEDLIARNGPPGRPPREPRQCAVQDGRQAGLSGDDRAADPAGSDADTLARAAQQSEERPDHARRATGALQAARGDGQSSRRPGLCRVRQVRDRGAGARRRAANRAERRRCGSAVGGGSPGRGYSERRGTASQPRWWRSFRR